MPACALSISTGHCTEIIRLGRSLCGEYKTRPLDFELTHKVSFLLSSEDPILLLSRSSHNPLQKDQVASCSALIGAREEAKKGQVKLQTLIHFLLALTIAQMWTTLPVH